MILDTDNTFAEALTLPQTQTTTIFGNVIDTQLPSGVGLGAAVSGGDGLNDVKHLVLDVTTSTTLTGATATVQFQLVSAPTATLTSSTKIHASSPVLTVGDARLSAGGRAWTQELPVDTYLRYVGILVITGVANLTAGAASAFLTPAATTWEATAAGI